VLLAPRAGLAGRVSRCLAPALLLAQASPAATTDGHVYAARTPSGPIRVLTLIAGAWPAGGLRIEDDNGAVLIAHVGPDAQAATSLDGPSRAVLAAMGDTFDAAQPGGQAAGAIRVLRLMTDWTLARAAGAGIELPADLHPKRLRVVLLGAGGEAQRTLDAVDVIGDAGPAAPADVHAVSNPRGIEIGWRADEHAAVPFVGYSLDRDDGSGMQPALSHAELLARAQDGKLVPILDRNPPVDITVKYAVRLVDVLGVSGAAANVEVFSTDFEAAAPPSGQKAAAGRGTVTLSWQAPGSSRTRALLVERAQLIGGPYERLTPEGLTPQTTQFVDQHVMPGATYYYRVRAMTTSGALGSPADPVSARALAAATLAAPTNLKAIVGTAAVQLTWQATPGIDVAGYIVERRMNASAPRWARLNQRPTGARE
jgi:hypothetical protein